MLGVLKFVPQRQAQAEQAVNEAALGYFQAVPGCAVAGFAEIGNDAGKPARLAERIGVLRRNGPVADIFLAVVLA